MPQAAVEVKEYERCSIYIHRYERRVKISIWWILFEEKITEATERADGQSHIALMSMSVFMMWPTKWSSQP